LNLSALKFVIIWIFIFVFPLTLFAQQKKVVFEQQIWPGYNATIKFNPRWGIWLDGEVHTNDHFFNNFSQFTLRFAGTYYLKNRNRFTAGYGYTDYLPQDEHNNMSIPEHFIWQQFQWYQNTSKHKLMQWVRMEEKWKENLLNDSTIDNSYTNILKGRYNIFYQIPLSKKGFQAQSLSLAIGDELYLYYGSTISNHVFDQNRVFLGFSYAVNKHDNFVFGYLNIQQQNATATTLKISSVLKATLFLNLGY
jgi:hypothetical protein